MKDPAFLFYYKDFENDTADWEADAVGWYLRLLIFQAGNGYVPSDIEELAQVARVRFSEFKNFSERWAYRLACKFQPLSEGKIYNKELSKLQADRKSGAIKKSVLAVFGNFIKSTELNDTELKDLKKSFHSQNHFLEISNAEIRRDEIIKFLNNEVDLIKNNDAKRYAKRSHMQSERNKAIANAIADEDRIEDVVEDEKEKEKRENLKIEKPKIEFEKIVEVFNSVCVKLPSVQKITPQRQSAIKARVDDYDLETIGKVFQIASKNNFLNGKNDRGWRADFDWIMNPNNFIKILEGKYQDTEKHRNAPGSLPDDYKLDLAKRLGMLT